MFRSQEVVEYVRLRSQGVTDVQELLEVTDIPEESHDAALLLEVEVELLVHVPGVLPQAGGLGHVLLHAQTFPLVPEQEAGGGRQEAGGRKETRSRRKKER